MENLELLCNFRLRNKTGDKWMNDSLIVYVEKDIFDKIDNEVIMKRL
jgi:hypothetical protein